MSNPKWHRDEIILALDLYFDANRGTLNKKNPKIIKLSDVLNNLPLFPYKPDAAKFRNTNGISLMLSNFLTLDPDYLGKGMDRFSKLDEKIFNEFFNDQERLRNVANEIKMVAKSRL